MVNSLQAATCRLEKTASSKLTILWPSHRVSVHAPRRHITAWTLMLALVVGAGISHAADLTWTGGDDVWQSTTAWTTNVTGGTGGFPGPGDDAFFTNAATYTVTLTADVLNIESNFFDNASNTTATVTLNLNTHELNPIYGGTSPGAFVVGNTATSTSIVYLASSTAAGKGLVVLARIVVGRNGFGTLIVTNGNVSVANTILANTPGGRGILVLSGPTVVWSNSSALAIGNASNTFGNTLVISNSARMDVGSSFRVGCGSSQSGSSNNTLLLDTGGKLTTHSGPVTIGHRSSGVPGSYNNTATVQGGAVWDNQNSSMVVGSADGGDATGNVLTVGASGFVTNVSQLTITAANTLNLLGGLLDATMTCTGTVQGFGTVLGDATIEDGGFLSPFNSQGALVFSNKLIMANTATTTVQLGTNTSATVAAGGLTLGGTLNITDGGGFTTGTYTLFTYNSTLTDNGLMIGTTPNSGFTYTIDTSASHAVNLVVSVPATPPHAVFTGSPTLGPIQLAVTFTDSSTGTITNRFWDFGDGTTTSTIETNLMHIYASTGTFDVALTVFGPLGSDKQTQSGYITATNVPLPSITSGVTASNAPLQIGNMIVVVGGDTNTFSVEATDPDSLPLTYQWLFGDGVTNAWPSSNTVDHAYSTNNCETYHASVTISNGVGTIASNFTVVVACQLNLAKLAPKLNFAKTNSDSCTVTGSFPLPDTGTPSFAGEQAILDIGGGSLTFTLPSKGSAVNGKSKFSTPTFNKKTGLWKLNVSFKNGFWQTEWANYSMINSNISKPGALVSDLPVILLLNGEAFMATTNLHYTAKQGKSGTAK